MNAGSLYSTQREILAYPAALGRSGIAELPITPRLTSAQVSEVVRADIARSDAAEKRTLPRPNWFPALSWKTLAVFAGGGLLIWLAVR